MEYERKTTFSKGRSRKTGIFVLLGTVCMIIFIIMTSVILFHQQRTFSVLESWMNIHSSNQTSAKPQEKNIETLMTNLASSITSKQEENQQKLDSLVSGCTDTEWIPFSNSCYLFSSHSMNWTEAKDYCEEQGALLLKLEEGSEKEWEVVTLLTKPFEYWIGLTDQTTGQWRWADDTPCTMDKVHWGPGQPDDWQGHPQEGGEDCAHISRYMKINDNHCSIKKKFICKGPKDS
ncbi:hypothetical protein R3I93_002586 [Phoxinus phoxinus]|uniref:C-type lectin domain-containing protein n=1 Tax=Phoxinus phoxinus TaxID=58324 RepID=A0AAN9DF29_9TELE